LILHFTAFGLVQAEERERERKGVIFNFNFIVNTKRSCSEEGRRRRGGCRVFAEALVVVSRRGEV